MQRDNIQAWAADSRLLSQPELTSTPKTKSINKIQRQSDEIRNPPVPSIQTVLPCSDQLWKALGYFRSRTALNTLGQHLPFSLCWLPPLLFCCTKLFYQRQSSRPASLDYVTILCPPNKNGNIFPAQSPDSVILISANVIRLWRTLTLLWNTEKPTLK